MALVYAEMPFMFGGKIGKQKIYISAINGPSLPPKPLVGPPVVQSCHSLSLFGGKKENRKICISVINGPSLPPNPLKLPNPLQTVTSSIDNLSRHGKNAWVSIGLAIIGHLTFTVRRSLAQTWHLWIDCSADGNIRLTKRNANKMQPALASSDATRYIKLPSSDSMVNQPTPQTRASCSQGSRFLRLKIHSTLSGVFQMKFQQMRICYSPPFWCYHDFIESIEALRPSIELWSHRRAGKTSVGKKGTGKKGTGKNGTGKKGTRKKWHRKKRHKVHDRKKWHNFFSIISIIQAIFFCWKQK